MTRLVDQSIRSLYGGVSQQSPVLRSENQCESAFNCVFTIADGVSKRPPLEVINELTSDDLTTSFCHWISDRNNSQYLLTITSEGNVKIYRVSDGNALNVTNDTEVPYLICGNAVEDLRAYTVEENTYIVNTSVNVEATTTVTEGTISGSAQTLQDDLLDTASNGQIYEIVGDTDNSFDTHYAKKDNGKWYEWVKPGIQKGLKPSTMPHKIELFFDEVDPLGVRFEVLEATWEERKVGDEKSNKFPSFIDKPITGVFFSNDRLCFLSSSSIVMSETGEHDNFFRTTVTDVLDTERIDVKEVSNDATSFYFAKPLGRNIMVFSEQKQWALTGDPILSPQTVSLDLATAYNASKLCEPNNAGSSLFFCVNVGNNTEVREMTVSEDSVSSVAANITGHIPTYIPKDVRLMEVQNNLDYMVLYSESTPDKLWVYNYKYSNNQKVQSAWNYWQLSSFCKIVDLKVIESDLLVVYTQTLDNGVEDVVTTHLGKINLKTRDPGIAEGFTYPIHLDLISKLTVAYDVNTNSSTFTCLSPMMHEDLVDKFQIVKGAGWADKGSYLTQDYPVTFVETSDDNHWIANGDWSTGDLFVGLPYDQEFEFSTIYPKTSSGVDIDHRFQIKHITVSFTDTSSFHTVIKHSGFESVESSYVPQLSQQFNSRTVGADFFRLNEPNLVTGTFTFPVMGNNELLSIKIVNDGHMPCNLQSAQARGLRCRK